MFTILLTKNPEQGQLLIRQFYVDPHYPFGLYSLVKLRKSLLPDDNKKFGYLHANVADLHSSRRSFRNLNQIMRQPYLRFLIKNKPSFIRLEELADSLYENFEISFSHWPLRYFFDVMNFNIDSLADIVEGVKKFVTYLDMFKGHYKGLFSGIFL